MKFNLKNSFKNARVKYGSYSTLMAVIVLAILVVINLVVGSLNLKFDLTTDKMYSITQETTDVLNTLDKDVTIYTLFETGQEEKTFTEILDQYKAKSNHVKIVNKDPVLYPQFVLGYTENSENIATGSIIVESGNKHKVIPSSDLIKTEMDYNTFQSYPVSIEIEPKVTAAISYVCSDNTPTMYVITGHDEEVLSASYKSAITDNNINLVDLNLLQADIPEDCAALLINSPRRDFSPDEAKKVLEYLKKEGRAIICDSINAEPLTNLDSILQAYGVSANNAVIIESDPNHMYSAQYPYYLLPQLNSHEITDSILAKKYPVFLTFAQGFNLLELKNRSTKIDVLAETSAKSYAKTDSNSQNIEKEASDIQGPFNLALAITDQWFDNDRTLTTKLVAFSSGSLFDDQANQAVSGTNSMFVIKTLNWLIEQKAESAYIPSKALQSSSLNINAQAKGTIALFSAIILPLVIFVLGFVIWLRRKNR